ncbi:MAG: hydantoinase/oxoprolinase family protein, partial [Phycisphaerae bacterium]
MDSARRADLDGGVVGCARVAARANINNIITFDMGGPSTDVSRYDGQFEYQYETQEAGVRIVTPMLAIETVAAGGVVGYLVVGVGRTLGSRFLATGRWGLAATLCVLAGGRWRVQV